MYYFILRVSDDFRSTQKFTPSFKTENSNQNFTSQNSLLKTSFREGNGLQITLTPNENVVSSFVCSPLSLLVHSPYELPGSYYLSDTIMFDYGFDLDVLITPRIIKTDESLRSVDPEERGCYFAGEKKLKFFKVYSRRNCEFECLSRALLKLSKRDCVPFFVVRANATEVCDYRYSIFSKRNTFLALRHISKCGCLDECNSIKYKVEVISHKLLNDSTATINFKFKEIDIIPLLRYHPFSFSEFLAQSGGMLGLIAGISFLSIFELFYFASMRWFTNFWRMICMKLYNHQL